MSVESCQFFLQNGYCTRGNSCTLYHARTQAEISTYNKIVNSITTDDKEDEYANVTEICFSFDTTASMTRVIDQVRQELKDIIKKLFSQISNIRIALIAHGDYNCSPYVIKHCNFTRDCKKLLNFVNKAVKSSGSGDGGECYEYALWTAANKLKWTHNARSKALVVIGDDQPHTPHFSRNINHLNWEKEIKNLKQHNITCFGIYCRYWDEHYEYFYQQIAKRTGGKYLELQNIKNITKLFVALCLKTSDDKELFEKYKNEILRSSVCNDELSRAIMSLSTMQKDAKVQKIKIDSGIKRLMYDLKEIKREKLIDIAVVPEENNVFKWHVNIKPIQGIFRDVYIHLTLLFPLIYPSSPPEISLISQIPNGIHSNIENNIVCLPLFGANKSNSKYGSSWSAAYSIISLLVNISSIFSEIKIKKKNITNKLLDCIRKTECSKCRHSHHTPFPVLGANKLPFQINEIIINEQHYKVAMEEAVKNKLKNKQQGLIKQERKDKTRGVLIAGNIIDTVKNGKFWKIKSEQGINRKYHNSVSWQFTIDRFDRRNKNKLYSDYIFGFVDNNNDEFFGVSVDGNVVFDNNAKYNELYEKTIIKQHSIISYILHLNNTHDELFIFVDYNLIAKVLLPTLYLKCDIFYIVMYVKDIRLELSLDNDPKLNDIINKNKQISFSKVEAFNKLQSSYVINAIDTIQNSGKYYKDQESWNILVEKALSNHILLGIFTYLNYSDLIHCRIVNTFWYSILSGHNVLDRIEMRCFYTHETIDNCKCILGVGLNVIKSSNKWITCAETEMDLLSLSAYKDYNIEKGAWGETINYFLPLIINEKHSKKAKKCLFNRLRKICDEQIFDWKDGLNVVVAIMNQFVVQLMANTIGFENNSSKTKRNFNVQKIDAKHASEKALIGYCTFHHMLLYLVEQFPQMKKYAKQSVKDFIKFPHKREKKETSSLGHFILLLAICDYNWKDIADVFVHESLDRQVKWYLQKYHVLEYVNDDKRCSNKQRIAYTLKSTIISRKLVQFQIFFLQNICKQDGCSLTDLLNNYNKRWGRPTNTQKDLLMKEVNNLVNKQDNDNSWLEFLQLMGVKKYKTNAQVCNALKKAVINSKNKEYHRSNERKIFQNGKNLNKRFKRHKRHYPPTPVKSHKSLSVEMNFGMKQRNNIEITDSEIIEMQAELEGHNDWITCIKVDVNNPNRIVTGSRDKSIVVWDIKSQNQNKMNGKMIRRLTGHNHYISDLDISSDGDYILSASWDGILKLWNAKTCKTIKKFVGHKKDVLAVQFSADNRKIISGGMDKMINLWNTIGELKQQINSAHNGWITCIMFSPNIDMDMFVSASQDKKVKVWEYDTKSLLYTIKYELIGHKSCITAMAISPDGSLCATGDKYGVLYLWDIEQGKLLTTLSTSSGGSQINCIIFSPNRYWVCIAVGNCVEIIDLETKGTVGILKLTKDQSLIENSKHYSTLDTCNCIAWSCDGKILYAGHSDSKIRVWKLLSNDI